MKIVFLSNYMNHHQQPLSDALWRKTGGDYCFVETAAMPAYRRTLGYPEVRREYVLEWKGHEAQVLQNIRQADVVIAGSAPETLVRQRVQTGKLLLRYSERPLKQGAEPLKFLPRWLRWHWRNPKGSPIYLLCAGAYTAGDYARFGLFRNRTFQWGYFPARKTYDLQILFSRKSTREILWCGRFLDFKHPEEAILAAHRLKQEGQDFLLRFAGTGELEEKLRKLVSTFGLEDHVQFLGARSPEEIRKLMEKSGVFLFTSDAEEGWGVVLNEAMNSGCAVVASRQAGAVPYLINDGENGLVYFRGEADALVGKLRYLLQHPQQQWRLGAAAYETIQTLWNPETAADRLLTLAQTLLAGDDAGRLFAEGPCSEATI